MHSQWRFPRAASLASAFEMSPCWLVFQRYIHLVPIAFRYFCNSNGLTVPRLSALYTRSTPFGHPPRFRSHPTMDTRLFILRTLVVGGELILHRPCCCRRRHDRHTGGFPAACSSSYSATESAEDTTFRSPAPSEGEPDTVSGLRGPEDMVSTPELADAPVPPAPGLSEPPL